MADILETAESTRLKDFVLLAKYGIAQRLALDVLLFEANEVMKGEGRNLLPQQAVDIVINAKVAGTEKTHKNAHLGGTGGSNGLDEALLRRAEEVRSLRQCIGNLFKYLYAVAKLVSL